MFSGIEYSSVEPTVNMFFLLSIFSFFLSCECTFTTVDIIINLRYVTPQRWLPIFHNIRASISSVLCSSPDFDWQKLLS